VISIFVIAVKLSIIFTYYAKIVKKIENGKLKIENGEWRMTKWASADSLTVTLTKFNRKECIPHAVGMHRLVEKMRDKIHSMP